MITMLTPVDDRDGGGNEAAGILTLFRILRLLRLTRMVRLMRALPELMTFIKGILTAMRSVGSTLVLLFMLLYCFSVLFTQLLNKDPNFKENYGDVRMSMITLFLAGTLLDDITDVAMNFYDN